jgi:hypothetical protein
MQLRPLSHKETRKEGVWLFRAGNYSCGSGAEPELPAKRSRTAAVAPILISDFSR